MRWLLDTHTEYMVALETSCVPSAAFTGWPVCALVCQELSRAAAGGGGRRVEGRGV